MAQLVGSHGEEMIRHQLETLATQSQSALQHRLRTSGFSGGEAIEKLDDGAGIRCRITANEPAGLTIDFSGSAESHAGNFNATPAIVRSAVLYVLRLWTQSDLPLNEGLLRDVEIVLPRCFLNPEFPGIATDCPAVVGGNVETSQRIVDTLLRILGIQAGSQGTMNNFIFGNESFGYYETIGGGAGAGAGLRWRQRSAHSHDQHRHHRPGNSRAPLSGSAPAICDSTQLRRGRKASRRRRLDPGNRVPEIIAGVPADSASNRRTERSRRRSARSKRMPNAPTRRGRDRASRGCLD